MSNGCPLNSPLKVSKDCALLISMGIWFQSLAPA